MVYTKDGDSPYLANGIRGVVNIPLIPEKQKIPQKAGGHMSNEELVSEIQKGFVTENMERLYTKNLPLIKKFIKPYTAFEDESDLRQEAFLGLWQAAQHYETDKNTLFSTYMQYWVMQSVRRYLEKCGSTIRIPSNTRAKMTKCRRAIEQIEQEQGREPAMKEIASLMGISEREVQEIKVHMLGVGSLDIPISDDGSLTLSDTLQGDLSVEDEAVDKTYAECSKRELWKIVERYTSEKENNVIKEIFINNQTLTAVARMQGISLTRARQIKEKGLRKLRTGKARRELMEKFDVLDAKIYRGGAAGYKSNNFTSITEYLAVERAAAKERYEKYLQEIEERHKEPLGLSGEK